MSDESQKTPGKADRRNGEARRDGDDAHYGHDDRLERGFDALRQLRESTKREALPERLRAVLEKLRRQN